MKKRSLRTLILSTAIILLIAGVLWYALDSGRGSDEEQAASIREAVSGRALQCYVIEGAYPESLEYLKDNYGLAVNTRDFMIVYTPYAENLPPDIRVIRRQD